MDSKSVEDYSYQWDLGTPVVAIDLGTSRSAMSVTFVGKEKRNQELILPDGCGSPSYGQAKTQTCLLLRLKTGNFSDYQDPIVDPTMVEVVAFGDAAERIYVDAPDEELANMCFAKWFKMLLHAPEAMETDPAVGSKKGIRVTLSVALALTLQLFKEQAKQHLERSHRREGVSAFDIVWILTVPAIWSDRAKHMMRFSALAAGLIASSDSSNLIFCLEPEGVAFHALFDGSDMLAVNDNYVDDETKSGYHVKDVFCKRGNKFLIVDAGGGTVDFGAYEVAETHPFKVKQIAAANGGPYGSTQVDKCFLDFVYSLIGDEAAASLKSRDSVQLELLAAWESIKINSCPQADRPSTIQLSNLQTEILGPLGISLKDLVGNYQNGDIALKGETRLELSVSSMRKIFSTSIDFITKSLHAYTSSTKASEVQYVVLAGGYSQCPYVWEAVNSLFVDKVNCIFRVSKPDTAIVRGASIYGTGHKSLVTHRVSRLTYGIKSLIKYDSSASCHIKRHKQVTKDDHDIPYIPTFRIIVHEGQEIPSGFLSEPANVTPFLEMQNSIRFQVLTSPNPHVRFPDEESVHEIAHFDVPVNMDLPFQDRISVVEFEFGGTEIHCSAKDFHTDSIIGTVQCKYF